jgi:calcium/calmodulin-dependent protein kinase I
MFNKKTEPPSAIRHKLYKMGKVIGSGSYGRVKKATLISTGELVAVKSMYKKDNTSEKSKKIIKREIEILSNLHHPNIINLLDAFETNAKWYLVTELVTGGELFDKIAEQGKLTEVFLAFLMQFSWMRPLSSIKFSMRFHVCTRKGLFTVI